MGGRENPASSTRGCSGTPGRGRWEKLWLNFFFSLKFSPSKLLYLLGFSMCKRWATHTQRAKQVNSPLDVHRRVGNKPPRQGVRYSSVRSVGSCSLKYGAPILPWNEETAGIASRNHSILAKLGRNGPFPVWTSNLGITPGCREQGMEIRVCPGDKFPVGCDPISQLIPVLPPLIRPQKTLGR